MRPSVGEQLEGIARVLDEVIVPEVSGAYPADVLSGLVANLRALADGDEQIEPFLRWDADATAEVLAMVDIAVSGPADEPQADRQRRLRGQLEDSMAVVVADDGARAAMLAHFRARSARFPFSLGGRHAHRAG